ncbi:MAG TPA: MBL fold metallo-hydrolase [Pseudonocardiaceae bacterium]|jgi:glyoxylase-like metal-dependent hydrolase (beta-lactamase superfamily II)|nr:MBL fold metallo-hydrolase [Pseudonocardiaceae bacterium]
MEITELLPRQLHLLRFPVGQAYLWTDPNDITLVDTGVPGQGAAIAAAIEGLGYRPGQLARMVITHHHQDHVGSADELRKRTGAPVLAHAGDIPYIQADIPPPDPASVLPPEELAKLRQIPPVDPAPPTTVDQAIGDGDRLDFGGGAVVLSVPGHTPGSIALHLPEHGVLFTGDTVASAEGRVIPGVFNVDRAGVLAALRRLSELDIGLACFGHGEPFSGDVPAALRAAAGLPALDGRRPTIGGP